MNIVEGSKKIAEYLGWVYIPFNDLQGLDKPGWYETRSAEPDYKKFTVKQYKAGEGDKITISEVTLDANRFLNNKKDGWKLAGDKYFKYVCRKHSDLRFYNSLDALIPVIRKIEEEFPLQFILRDNGCALNNKEVFNLPNWSNNVFKVIIETL